MADCSPVWPVRVGQPVRVDKPDLGPCVRGSQGPHYISKYSSSRSVKLERVKELPRRATLVMRKEAGSVSVQDDIQQARK
eukprot:952460-Rhodomonas_salina.3